MAKEAYYFSHDTNARTDPKIMAMLLEYKAEGFGLYWATIEMMCEHNEYKLKHNKITFNAIAMAMLCDSNRVAEFIHSCVTDYELFTTDGEYFWSESLLRRMNLKDEKRQKRVNAGKKGADSRWKNGNAIANESQSDSNAIAKDGKGKERKVKENKENKENIISGYTSNDRLIQAINDFITMRKQIKKVMTPRAIELMLMELDKLASDDNTKIEILNQSIQNSWQGVFELKQINKPKQQTNGVKPINSEKLIRRDDY